jgi:hypothetical protein
MISKSRIRAPPLHFRVLTPPPARRSRHHLKRSTASLADSLSRGLERIFKRKIINPNLTPKSDIRNPTSPFHIRHHQSDIRHSLPHHLFHLRVVLGFDGAGVEQLVD